MGSSLTIENVHAAYGAVRVIEDVSMTVNAGETVTLKPSGQHIMLMGLKQQLKPGDTIPITLKIENSSKKVDTVIVNAEVREEPTDSSTGGHHDHMR